MCRPPPKDFNQHQRAAFCVYSGKGVHELRKFLQQHYSEERRKAASSSNPASSPGGNAGAEDPETNALLHPFGPLPLHVQELLANHAATSEIHGSSSNGRHRSSRPGGSSSRTSGGGSRSHRSNNHSHGQAQAQGSQPAAYNLRSQAQAQANNNNATPSGSIIWVDDSDEETVNALLSGHRQAQAQGSGQGRTTSSILAGGSRLTRDADEDVTMTSVPPTTSTSNNTTTTTQFPRLFFSGTNLPNLRQDSGSTANTASNSTSQANGNGNEATEQEERIAAQLDALATPPLPGVVGAQAQIEPGFSQFWNQLQGQRGSGSGGNGRG